MSGLRDAVGLAERQAAEPEALLPQEAVATVEKPPARAETPAAPERAAASAGAAGERAHPQTATVET